MCGTLDESGSETHLNRAPWSLGSGNASVFLCVCVAVGVNGSIIYVVKSGCVFWLLLTSREEYSDLVQ